MNLAMEFAYWQPFLISASIGLLVGLERQKSQPGENPFGVRTFLLVSILGAVVGSLSDGLVAAAVSALVVSLISISYFLSVKDGTADHGLTTEFAAGVVFALGYVSHSRPVLASVLGILVALVLVVKTPLHRLTAKISVRELRTVLLLLLLAITVLSLLEDRTVDPWGVFNPRKFGLLILVLATLEFASYVLIRVFGRERGALMAGFFGGLVSSTAVLLSSLKHVSSSRDRYFAFNAVAMAQVAACAELLFIVAISSPEILLPVTLPIGLAMTIIVAVVYFSLRKNSSASTELSMTSPLDWRGVIRLSFIFMILLAAVAGAQRSIGQGGSAAVSFIGGIFELHGVSLANTVMFANGQIASESAVKNILLALSGSLCGKAVLCAVVVRNRFTLKLSAFFLALVGVLWAAWILGAGTV